MLSNLKNKILSLSFILIVSIIALSVYTVNTTLKCKKLSKLFQIEHQSLIKEIDEILGDLNDISIDEDNFLSNEVNKRRYLLASLKKTLNKLSIDDYSLTNNYRKKFRSITSNNRKLFYKIDSLNLMEGTSTDTKFTKSPFPSYSEFPSIVVRVTPIATSAGISVKGKRFREQTSSNEIIPPLNVVNINLESLKKNTKSNDYINEYRYDEVSALKVSFHILKDDSIKAGKKMVHIQILTEDMDVIRPLSLFNSDRGNSSAYTACFSIDYCHQDLSVMSLLTFDKKTFTKEGNYSVRIYIDGKLKKNGVITLS